MLLAIVWIGWVLWQTGRGQIKGVLPSAAAVTCGLLLLLIIGVSAMTGLESAVHRWGRLARDLSSSNPRLLVAQVCLEMIGDSGWFGFGPGSWQASFPYFAQAIADRTAGVWEHAHDDYLETLIDWGFIGTAGWAVVVFGGIIGSCLRFWRRRAQLSAAQRATHFGILTAMLGVLLHSLVDFPLQIMSIQLSFATLAGMSWAARCWLRDEEAPQKRHRRRGVAPAKAVASSF
ncbi:MAG TPA: O-antigen ligase family protein [Tepidisphaeraceae bacterium]|nr:O-antigen ligase family protein [Tepidisphaeraceae bacterium]